MHFGRTFTLILTYFDPPPKKKTEFSIKIFFLLIFDLTKVAEKLGLFSLLKTFQNCIKSIARTNGSDCSICVLNEPSSHAKQKGVFHHSTAFFGVWNICACVMVWQQQYRMQKEPLGNVAHFSNSFCSIGDAVKV